MQGYSVADTAALLGVAEGTIKSRCSRARVRLAELLGHFKAGARATPDRPAVSCSTRPWLPGCA
jgi:RNA polymerase sigma-70 factor (ECF subfamily)